MFRTYKDTVRPKVPAKVNKEVPLQYFCEFCDDSSDTMVWSLEPDLEIHRRSVHKGSLLLLLSDPNNFMCSVCLHKQPDRNSLIAHIKTHHLLSPPHAKRVKREIFICDYCNKVFFNKQLLAVHIQSLHLLSNIEKKKAIAVCPYCFQNTPVKSIWFHFLSHGIINTASCPICMRSYYDTFEVLEHVESHPGYYNCIICPYETNKENLFLNHIERHKKPVNLEEKGDAKSVSRYFVPETKPFSWSGKVLNIFQGIKLAPEIKICILCREMCLTDEEMVTHIYGDHSPNRVTEAKRYLCVCGEEFSNNILLKHHIFQLKGEHKVFNGTKQELDILLANKNMQELAYDEAIMDTYEMVYAMNNDSHKMQIESSSETLKNVEELSNNTYDKNIEPIILNVNYESSNNTIGMKNASSSNTFEINSELSNSPVEMDSESSNNTLVINIETSDNVLEINTETNITTNITSGSNINKSSIYTSVLEEFDGQSFESPNGTSLSAHNHNAIVQNQQNAILINNDLTKGYYKQLMVIEDGQIRMYDGSESVEQYLPKQQVVFVQVNADEPSDRVDVGDCSSVAVEDPADFFPINTGVHSDYTDVEDCNSVTVEDSDDVIDKESFILS